MIYVITGVPGTGKTTVARELSKRLGARMVSVSDFFQGEVSLKAVRAKMWWEIKRGARVLEGHLLCEVRLPADLVVVLRTRPSVLYERLSARGYPEDKVMENVMAEALDYCLLKAEERYKHVIQVDTTGKSVEDVVEQILRGKGDEVDWEEELYTLILRKSTI